MKISSDMQELLVLIALRHEEISEGRAVELLGMKREKIRELRDAKTGVSPRVAALEECLDDISAIIGEMRVLADSGQAESLRNISQRCRDAIGVIVAAR